MFVLRSAFWLGLAFLLMAPQGTDPGAEARRVAGEIGQVALETGSSAAIDGLLGAPCETIECLTGKAALTGFATSKVFPSGASTMQEASPVPLPRPRPDRMG